MERPDRRLNLVVICIDTLREDFVRHAAPWDARMPHIDALRERSVYFERAFGEGLPTIPMRRAYFTGMRSFPWRFDFDTQGMWPTGRGWHKIAPEERTLAEVLLGHGYHTGLISDTYHMFKPTMNFARGFLSYEFIRGLEADPYLNGRITVEDLAPYVKNPDPVEAHSVLVQYLLNAQERHCEDDWTTARVFTRASEWVKRQHVDDPFFLWIDAFGVHEPWDPPASYLDEYSSGRPGPVESIYPVNMKTEDFSSVEADRVRALYQASVTFVDHWIGEFLSALAEHGHQDNTVVMLVNDHGTELLDHGQFSKAASRLYAHNTQSIWMIAHPDRPAATVGEFVQSHDLYPTALQILGVESPQVDGEALWNWEGDTLRGPGRSHVVIGFGRNVSIRDLEWNYFVDFEHSGAGRLYHLATDPLEQENVVEQFPEQVNRLRGLLEEFLGQPLPATLSDVVHPGDAPIRVLMRSRIRQEKRDAGFV